MPLSRQPKMARALARAPPHSLRWPGILRRRRIMPVGTRSTDVPLLRVPLLFLLILFNRSKFRRSRFGLNHQRLEVPLALGLHDRLIILRRADFFGRAVEKLKL